jgi:uncharacterized protein (DUF58 family)
MIAPDLDELLALRGAAQGLRLPSRRPSRALHAGAHRSAHRGRGLEFQEVRPYVSGDDPRTIDWRVTARRGRPHTKLFREERERPVWLLADLNAAMFFGTRRQLKSSVVVRAAALIAWSASLGGDRVGAVVAGTSSYRILPPRAREAGVLPLLATLIEMQPTSPSAPSSESLSNGVRALGPLVHPGSLVLALSDFAALDESAASAWAALAVHNVSASDCRAARCSWMARAHALSGSRDGASGKQGSRNSHFTARLQSSGSTRASRSKTCCEPLCREDGLPHEFGLVEATCA